MKRNLLHTLSLFLALLLLSSAVLPSFATASAAPEKALFCSACGREIPPESKFCFYCGNKVTEPVNTPRTFTSGSDMDVGDILVLGSLELDGYYNGGEALEWLILEKEGTRLLLVSRYALSFRPFRDETSEGWTWEDCSLRAWLNGEFLESAFSEKEQAMILPATVSADKNPFYDSDPGNPTEDRVFLLSADEANHYFPSAKARICEAWGDPSGNSGHHRPNGRCVWWLRTQGLYTGYPTTVDSSGVVSWNGANNANENVAVRPALWVDLASEAWQTISAENAKRDRVFSDRIRSMGLHDVQDLLAAAQAVEKPGDGDFPHADRSSIDAQIQLILDNRDLWYVESSVHPVLFTVTDFDHNGRLEVIYAENYGSGNRTTLGIWEVNSGFTGLNSLGNGITSSFMMTYSDSDSYQDAATPDLIPESAFRDWGDLVTQINAYYLDPSGTTYYALRNITGSMESAEELGECLVLEDGKLRIFPVAWRYRDQFWRSSYYDYQGNPIGSGSFANWESVFKGYNTRPVRLHWISPGFCAFQTLRDAYEAFCNL